MLLLANVGFLQAAAPVSSTIWLHYSGPDADDQPADAYVEMDPGRDNALIALNSSSVGTNEQFIVEDAGNGNILLKSVANSMYAIADTSTTSNILRAETTSTTEPLSLLEWIDNGDGTISLYNSNLNKYVKVQGVNQYLKVTRADIEPDTKFTWGIVGGVDTDPPTPNPATFATAPVAVGSAVVTMTATTGADLTGPIEYYFAETSGNGGGDDSGWQSDPSYSDTDLSPGTEYTYTVTMRDSVTPTPNAGSASAPASATTNAIDTDPPTPNPASFATAPVALSSAIITMTATTGSDATGPIEYYFSETSGHAGGTDSGWQTSSSYSDNGLSPETEYTYTVTMRDGETPTPNVGSASAPASATTGVASDIPNIVFMYADDLGFGDLACSGHPYARTPALDKLATEGTRFTQAYSTGKTCNPSRIGYMSGISPQRYARADGISVDDGGFGDHPTITELLHNHGYRIGHYGKWHMGPTGPAYTYGMDEIDTPSDNPGDALVGRDGELYNNAIGFIDRHVQNHPGVPFYVNIWGHSTHASVNPPTVYFDEFAGLVVDRDDFFWHPVNPTTDVMGIQREFDHCIAYGYDISTAMQNYVADVWSIDLNVARVLAKLDELGLSDNTIVVFSGDQGPDPVNQGGDDPYEPYTQNLLGYSGIYRGGKHTLYEGCMRTPFIIRWPDHIDANVVDTENVISGMDWLPTLCSIAGIDDIPDGLDGEDVSDIWFGATRPREKMQFWTSTDGGVNISMRKGKWKMHHTLGNSVPTGLYDLSVDPSESINVAGANPAVANELIADMEAWDESLSYDPVPGVVDQDQTTAEADIVSAGFTVGTVTTAHSPTVPIGDVISQDPIAGTYTPAGTSVDLVVSDGTGCAGPADFDCDGNVDIDDVSYMAGVWLTSDTTADIAEPADGIVSLPDFSILSQQWLP